MAFSSSRSIKFFFILSLATISTSINAGFLDMPEITETPTLQRESMLRDIDIPSVRERDPNPEAGPRLAVSEFRLQGIVEYPELGITRAQISKLVEDIRFDMMDEGKLLDSGFSLEELSEVSNLLVEIEKETVDRHITPIEVQRLVWLVREQRAKRGITLGMIETIADKITNYYRERGFILAKAYIPKQEVREGVVNLTLLLGHLGNINVQNNNLYSENTISSVFDEILASPVTHNTIEERLYLLNDYPGLVVHGYFEPGAQVGDSSLTINVKNEKQYDGNVRLDNHGSEETGEYRLYAEIYSNNPLGNADVLHLAYLNSFSPDNSNYWQIRYKTNFVNAYNQLTFLSATNQFDLGPGNVEAINALRLTGDTTQSKIEYNHIFKRSRKENHKVGLGISEIESKIDTLNAGTFGGVFDDTVRNTSLSYVYDILNEDKKLLHQGNLSLTSGKFIKGVELSGLQDEEYYFANYDYTLLSFFKVPYFNADTRIITNASFQYASSPLSSINQFNIGGPTRVRAYPVNKFSADNAAYMGVEWLFNTPDYLDFKLTDKVRFKDASQLFLFADMSYGIQMTIDPAKEDEKGELADIGFGLKLSYLNDFKGNIQIAFPVHSKFSSEDISNESDSVRVVFDFQYRFL